MGRSTSSRERHHRLADFSPGSSRELKSSRQSIENPSNAQQEQQLLLFWDDGKVSPGESGSSVCATTSSEPRHYRDAQENRKEE